MKAFKQQTKSLKIAAIIERYDRKQAMGEDFLLMKTQCYISHLSAYFEHFSSACMYLPSLQSLLVLDLSTQWCAFLQFSADVHVPWFDR